MKDRTVNGTFASGTPSKTSRGGFGCLFAPSRGLTRLGNGRKRQERVGSRKLNPKARLVRATAAAVPLGEILNTRSFDMDEAASHPGWLAEAPGTHVPETEEYGISGRVFQARRPLHPQRFWDLITGPAFTGVIHSKGFVCPNCGGDIRLREEDGRQEPAYVEPEVRKREKARMASPA